ncbi:hypothetical protein F511_16919 [Dorcoceras hygrometricum]|uniref:Uncharacterized protein n=1 Tax=Dorcoceras hygrometricum TaxID=472368 RepID=A0A2Z7AYI4_9LAMI|nr:hypothetical protein F511_16919 [Dorcoceras hygrometricum]
MAGSGLDVRPHGVTRSGWAARFRCIVREVWCTVGAVIGSYGTVWTWGWPNRRGSGHGGRSREVDVCLWRMVAAASRYELRSDESSLGEKMSKLIQYGTPELIQRTISKLIQLTAKISTEETSLDGAHTWNSSRWSREVVKQLRQTANRLERSRSDMRAPHSYHAQINSRALNSSNQLSHTTGTKNKKGQTSLCLTTQQITAQSCTLPAHTKTHQILLSTLAILNTSQLRRLRSLRTLLIQLRMLYSAYDFQNSLRWSTQLTVV